MRKGFDEIIKLGEMFRRARNQKGIALKQAAESTRIREPYLEALENSDYSSLPAPVYTKGFIKNYAKYLGINPVSALAFYRREHEDSNKVVSIEPFHEPKKNLNLDFFRTQRGLFTIITLLIVGLFLVYIITRFTNVISPPDFVLSSPLTISSGSEQTFVTEEPSITIKGKLQVGSSLNLNGSEVDTKNLEIFEIPDLKLENGENTFTFIATSEFGIESKIILKVDKKTGTPAATPTPTIDVQNPAEQEFDEMFVEIIIGPREANLVVTIDGVEKQNWVEVPDTVKTYKATRSLIIQSPRPDSVRIAINGEEHLLNTAAPVEWNLIEGQVIRKK